MNRNHWLMCIAAIIAVCAFPARAAATEGSLVIGTTRSGHFIVNPSRSTEFHVKGSGGYSISVLGNHGRVYFTAMRGNALVTYSVRGTTSPEQVKATLGHLGRVSVRFHPDGPVRLFPLPKGNCRGRGELVQTGTFVGAIEFEGEQGYTALHLSRARGNMTKTLKQRCSEDSGGKGPKVSWTILGANSKSQGASFLAFKIASRAEPELSGTSFAATIIETLGRLTVFRSIGATASPDAFTAVRSGGDVTSATVAPPPPFTGTATYEKTSSSGGTWTGTLTGDFLGRGVVALAGPEFAAEILN